MNALGEKEMIPVVIGKSAKPRCFKRINTSQLPVQYFSQSKAWMTSDIMHQVLQKFKRRLVSSARHILLLMDNAGCHPHDLCGKYSNIKIVFLPPSTTSVIQPLDLGVIKNFKVHYRRLLLSHIIAKIEDENCSTAAEITKSVTLLHAIRWVGQAWEMVKSTTIKKCFRKAGVLDSDYQVVTRNVENPFAADHEESDDMNHMQIAELQSLISQVQQDGDTCTAEQFVNADDDLPTCIDMYGDEWDSEFFTAIRRDNSEHLTQCDDNNSTTDDSEDDLDSGLTPTQPRIQSLGEVMQQLEDVRVYLDHIGRTDVANKINKNNRHSCFIKGSTKTINQYFTN